MAEGPVGTTGRFSLIRSRRQQRFPPRIRMQRFEVRRDFQILVHRPAWQHSGVRLQAQTRCLELFERALCVVPGCIHFGDGHGDCRVGIRLLRQRDQARQHRIAFALIRERIAVE